MRNHLFLLIFFFLLPYAARSQQFAPAGAQWHYFGTYYSTFGEGEHWHTLIHAYADADTFISGVPCRPIRQEAIAKTSRYSFGSAINELDTFPLRTLYVYDNTDTVFIYNENFGRFTPLYVFNVAEGDTVCLPVIPDIYDRSALLYNPLSGDTSFCYVVDSIRTVAYDTAHLRTFYTSFLSPAGKGIFTGDVPLYNWSSKSIYATPSGKGNYTEKIGGLQGGLLPVELINYVDKPTEARLQTFKMDLRCYLDGAYDIRLTEGPCDSLPPNLTVGIGDVPDAGNPLSVFPNPGHDAVNIVWYRSTAAGATLTLTDLTGRVVLRSSVPARQNQLSIPLGKVSEGVYLLTLASQDVKYYRKLSVVH